MFFAHSQRFPLLILQSFSRLEAQLVPSLEEIDTAAPSSYCTVPATVEAKLCLMK